MLFRNLAILCAVLLFAACKEDDAPDPGGLSSLGTVIAIDGPSTASAGEAIELTVIASEHETSIDSFTWTFSDGETATGETISKTFAAQGVVTVLVEAKQGAEVVAEADGVIAVYDGTSNNPGIPALPALFGDVGLDGAVELDDVLLALQAVSGIYELDDDAFKAADMNVSGTVDETDARLLAQAVLNGAALPSVLLSEEAYPLELVTMISPGLLDPASELSVLVDGIEALNTTRLVLGYATFVVPPNVPATGQTVLVELLVDGAVADTFSLIMRPLVAKPADAKADVQSFLDQMMDALDAQASATAAYVNEVGNLTDEETSILLGASSGAADQFAQAVDDITALLNGPQGDELAAWLQHAMYVGGMDEFRAQYAEFRANGLLPPAGPAPTGPGRQGTSLSATSVPDCTLYIDATCALLAAADVTSFGAKALSYTCSLSALVTLVGPSVVSGGTAVPAAAATALAGFVKFCVPLSVPLEVAGIVTDLIKTINLDFKITSDKSSLQPTEVAVIKSEVIFAGINELCGLGAQKGAEGLIKKKLGERIVGLMMTRSATYKVLGEIWLKIGEKAYVSFLDTVAGAVGTALDATGILDAFQNFSSKVCNLIIPGSGAVGTMIADAAKVPLATTGGQLSFLADGTANFSCPVDPAVTQSTFTVSGSKELCFKKAGFFSIPSREVKSASVDISCGSKDVIITMGDNGAANDDIYEIIYNGVSILTSSEPVRSTSVTIQLPPGNHTILMRGRAAPDGIGTYFISFSGATVLPGSSPTSGSDLTPGVTKTFLIEVQ